MKQKTIFTLVMFILCASLLSGCTLFPLREDEAPVVKATEEETPEAVDPNDVIAPQEVQDAKDTMYCISAVNIRDAASSNSNVIGELTAGQKVTVLSHKNGWIEIEYKGGSAFVYENYLGNTPDEDDE